MKRLITILLISLLAFSVIGCSKQTMDTSKNNTQNAQRQFNQTPESKLRRTAMGIIQLDNGESTITTEQAQKLLPIIKEIKTKEAIDETYANTKIEEIKSIYTEQQKEIFNQGPQGNRRDMQADKSDSLNNLNMQNDLKRSNRPDNAQPPQDTKAIYDQIITILEQKNK